jgi:hypothetical protein
LSFVTVRILDASGNVVPDADNLVDFKVDGLGFIAGVDNGFQASLEPFQSELPQSFPWIVFSDSAINRKKRNNKINGHISWFSFLVDYN